MTKLLWAVGVLGLVGQALAFPSMAADFAAKKHAGHKKRVTPGFNAAAQHIDVSGAHAFVPPGHTDQRGPCPGLNALANHNYLPHNGVATINQFVNATNAVYGMGLDLATFLSVYGAVFDGDLLSWSIGGAPATYSSLAGLLSQPQGLDGSHNKYESDVSPTRGDLYQYGNNYLVQMSQFNALYNKQAGVPEAQSNYGLELLDNFRAERFQQSIDNNPYFFNAPFSGVIVQPAAYTFIYRFMANKSAEYPEGRLSKSVLKSFFAITGDEGSFKYTPGYERIPDNWYKRAIGDEYTIPYYIVDLDAAALEHPEFLSVGGNTGKTDTYAAVDITNLTGGAYSSATLLQGNNLACFGFEAGVQAAPDILKGYLADTTAAISLLSGALSKALAGLGCPQLSKYDTTQLQKFPGYTKLKANGQY